MEGGQRETVGVTFWAPKNMTWALKFQFWEPNGLPEIFLGQQPCYWIKNKDLSTIEVLSYEHVLFELV